jgi:hypothetical protein
MSCGRRPIACSSRDIVKNPIDYALGKALRTTARLLAPMVGSVERLQRGTKLLAEEDIRRQSPLEKAFDGARTADGDIWIS